MRVTASLGYQLSSIALIIQRAFPLECGVQPLRIVKIIDIVCDDLLNLLRRHPCVPPQELSFQGLEETLRDSSLPAVYQQFTFLLMEPIKP